MPVITIDPSKIILGESQSAWTSERGFSPSSYGLNLTKMKGLLYFAPTVTDRGGATLTGNIIASAYDRTYSGNDAYFLDNEGAFYTLSGATFTKKQTVAADTFITGTSDLLQYKDNLYATSETRVIYLAASGLTSVDSSWWTGLKSACRHPLERVEDTLYIGDQYEIHTWNGTSSTAAAITLPTDVNITSLRKHPDGKTLLAFCGLSANYSHTRGLGGRIYFIDTNLKNWTREIDIEMQVEGSQTVGGVIYVTYGDSVGYFDGNGVKFLKRLSNNSGTTYSNNIVAYEDKLVIRDGRDALVFGDLGGGRVWWRIFKTSIAKDISCLRYLGDNKMLFAYQDAGGTAGNLEEVDYDNVGTNGTFISNKYIFPQKVRIRRIEVIHDVSNSAGTTQFTVYNLDTEGTATTIFSPIYTNQSTTKTEFFVDVDTDIFQFQIVNQTDDIGYKLIRIHYESIN